MQASCELLWGNYPGSEVLSGKCPKRSGPDGEVLDNLAVIIVGSLERASSALLALEGAAQEVPKEPCASAEDGVPNRGPLDAVKAVGEAHLGIVAKLSFSVRLVNTAPVG